MRLFSRNIKHVILIIVCTLLCSGTLQAQLQCVIGGAGTSGVNGTYVWDGSATNTDGNPVFSHTQNNYYLHLSGHYEFDNEWIINTSATWTDSGSNVHYYNTSSGTSNTEPPTSGWIRYGESYTAGQSCYDYSNPDCDTDNCYCYTASGTSYEADAPAPNSFVCGPAPIPVVTVQDGCWAKVFSGRSFSIGQKPDGTLWSWGIALNGRLGNGTTSGNVHVPTQFSTDTDWASIEIGRAYCMAIKTDGTLWAWGYDGYGGALGLGVANGGVSVPTQVGTDTDWASVAAGENNHSMGLKTDGTLWTWGGASDGKLGNGTTSGNVLVPTQIGTDTDWASISASYGTSMALKTDGTLWAWGRNNKGALGNGLTSGSTNVPTQIGTDTDWVSIDAEDNHSIGQKTDGTLWAWGEALNGKLGNGMTGYNNFVTTPTQISTDTDWASFTAGANASMAMKTDGTLWLCGNAVTGLQGNGTTNGDVLYLTQLGSRTDWMTVSGRHIHMSALTTDGTLWTWGDAYSGGLGNGNDTDDISNPITPSQVNASEKGVTKTTTSNRIGNDGDWTYYYKNDEGGYFFAINWAPDGSLSTANDAALRNSTVTIDVMSNYDSQTSGADGSFIMGRYWNVDTDGNNIDEPINIRFYYDPTEITDIEDAAAAYASSNGSVARDFQWFMQNSTFDPTTDNTSSFAPDTELIAASTGTAGCGNTYVQIDGVSSLSGGGGGMVAVFPDIIDTDTDGIADDADNCPNTANADQADDDGDGIGNVCDTCPLDADNDADGDGVCGDVDLCPGFDDTIDSDFDGYADGCDSCPLDFNNDFDGDGVCGDVDLCPGFDDNADSDGDGTADGCDSCPLDADNDADGDGVCGDVDLCPGFDDNADSDGDGIADGCDTCPLDADNDADGDGVCGDVDLCPGFDDNVDSDLDGIADGCDTCPLDPDNDADGDGVCGDVDLCPGFDDTIDSDFDGYADGCDTCPLDFNNDFDGDGVCGDVDLCPGFDDNIDSDGDSVADGCDACPGFDDTVDADGDGVADGCDVCPGFDDTADADNDGVADGCDVCPGFDDTADADNDGIADGCDACPGFDDTIDSDLDGIADGCDTCPLDPDNDADGDGICGNVDTCPFDADNDADSDGVCGNVDACPGFDDNIDVDLDNIPDDCDNCIAPPPVSNDVTILSSALVSIDWDDVPNAIFYQVKYRIKGTTFWFTTGSALSKRPINNLTANKYYQYKIRTKCTDGTWSGFTSIDEFYTSTCDVPTGVADIYLDDTRRRIRWDGGPEPAVKRGRVKYRAAGGTWVNKNSLIGNNYLYLTGLTPNTTYEYRVRQECTNGDWSDYTVKYFFTTSQAMPREVTDNDDLIENVKLYPNPAHSELNVSFESAASNDIRIVVTDILGKVMQTKVITSQEGSNLETINVGDLTKGYYLLTVYNGDDMQTVKFIKS